MSETSDPKEQPDAGRSRWLGLVAIGGAAVVAFVVTLGIFVPAIGAILEGVGTPAARDPATLPEQILVCDREYARDAAPVAMTLEEVRARAGPATIVSGLPGSCPDGVCVEGGLCLTVVWVSAGQDRYVAYDLQGGP